MTQYQGTSVVGGFVGSDNAVEFGVAVAISTPHISLGKNEAVKLSSYSGCLLKGEVLFILPPSFIMPPEASTSQSTRHIVLKKGCLMAH